jgi:nucleotide-binding universal stress UspA family protein
VHERILVAIDGSHTSTRALREALRLAESPATRLRLVHVVDSPYTYPEVLYGEVRADVERLRQSWRQAGQTVLDRAADTARQAGAKVETALLDGEGRRVPSVIVEEAGRWAAELLVVGTHGRRGLEHMLLGSVAEGVTRHATVPILLVRGQ